MKERMFDYLVTNTGVLTMQDILLNFSVAAILGVIIYFSYRFSHSGAVYSPRFNVSLVMLTLVTTLVMNVIGNNIALSLGMVGALSIVRFRTAVKDPRDTAYIFWCIAVGICCGVSEYMIAGIGTGVIFVFLLIFGIVKPNDRYLLVIRGAGSICEEAEKVVNHFFKGNARLRVKNTSKDATEYIYEISARMLQESIKRSGDITPLLYGIEGVKNVNLVCQNDEINR